MWKKEDRRTKMARRGAMECGSKDLDVQMQNMEHFLFLFTAFFHHGLKTGESFFELLQVVGSAMREPDDCHLNGGRSMTWSFDFGRCLGHALGRKK
jgi:hypothetical protein